MKLKNLLIVTFLSVLHSSVAIAEDDNTEYLIVAPDLSGSSLFLTSDSFAQTAIARITQKISGLKKGAWVEIKTFGDGSLEHIKTRKTRISSQGNTPDYVASLVDTTLNKIKTEAGQGQSSTQLINFLELEELHCDTGATEIILITDAIESSIDVSSKTLLDGSKPLPKPVTGFLSGCSVTIIGLGSIYFGTMSRDERINLEAAWQQWFKEAGVDDLTIIHRS